MLSAWMLAPAGVLSAALSLCPRAEYTSGHADLRPVLTDGRLSLVLQRDGQAPLAGEDVVILGQETPYIAARPSGERWDFLGTPEGEPLWMLPQNSSAQLPFLGLSGESLPAGSFAGGVRMQLVDFRGPGAFAMYTTGSFGAVTVLMASSDGLNESDAVTIPVGSHVHQWWSFAQQGRYELTFVASGTTPAGDHIDGEPATFRFEIPPVCTADFNLDGQRTVQDLLAYLSAFRARDMNADYTEDCAITVQDLLAFLSAFRAGC